MTIGLRTQPIIAFESGVTQTIDPLAGLYDIGQLTDEIQDAPDRYQKAVEAGDRILVGVKDSSPMMTNNRATGSRSIPRSEAGE